VQQDFCTVDALHLLQQLFGTATAALAVWNSLPEKVQSSTSLPLFRRRVMSELFPLKCITGVKKLGQNRGTDCRILTLANSFLFFWAPND